MPGALLGSSDEIRKGAGTYEKDGRVYGSVLGVESRTAAAEGDEDNRPTVSVTHWRRKPSNGTTANGTTVPVVGQSVMGRVTRITAGVANVDIICVDQRVLPVPSAGIIRVEDVFPADVDHSAVQMTNCFRPGDVVRARIMAMGDTRQYYLTAAAADLGVAWTRDPAGEILLPVAWDQVASPVSGSAQARKAAKPLEGAKFLAPSASSDSPDGRNNHSESSTEAAPASKKTKLGVI